MVSEWTLNPRQLIKNNIIINYWQRNGWKIISYQGDFFDGNFNGHEGYDNLGCHMVGQQTLRLEKLWFDIAKCTIDSINWWPSRQLAWFLAQRPCSWLWLCVVPEHSRRSCIVSMQLNCEQTKQIWHLKTGMNLLVIFLDTMPMSLNCDNLKSMKYQPF